MSECGAAGVAAGGPATLRRHARSRGVQHAAPEARAAALARLDDLRGHWWHWIDLGDGVRTEGRKSAEILRKELADVDLPDVRGKSVLDIGTWDGFLLLFRGRAPGRRATSSRSTYFVWSLDLDARRAYLARCHEEGRTPQPWNEVPEVWKPDTLRAKACFDTPRWRRSAATSSRSSPISSRSTSTRWARSTSCSSSASYTTSSTRTRPCAGSPK